MSHRAALFGKIGKSEGRAPRRWGGGRATHTVAEARQYGAGQVQVHARQPQPQPQPCQRPYQAPGRGPGCQRPRPTGTDGAPAAARSPPGLQVRAGRGRGGRGGAPCGACPHRGLQPQPSVLLLPSLGRPAMDGLSLLSGRTRAHTHGNRPTMQRPRACSGRGQEGPHAQPQVVEEADRVAKHACAAHDLVELGQQSARVVALQGAHGSGGQGGGGCRGVCVAKG